MAVNMSVMGIYPDRTTVSDAVKVMLRAGYRATDISILASDNQGTKDFAHHARSKAFPYAAVGAALGATVGAAFAWLIASQTTTIAGTMPLVTAGPVIGALAGAGVGGTVGWIAGLLAGLPFTEYIARRYAGRIRHGGILLSVHCDTPEWSTRAKKTLKDTGARRISSALESSADFGTTDKPTERAPVAISDRAELISHPAIEPVVHDATK